MSKISKSKKIFFPIKTMITIVAILFIYNSRIFAQERKISGKVTDGKNNPIEFVNIGIQGKNIGTISNTKGNFELAIPNENSDDTLTFSIIGYKNKTILIKNITGFLNFQLSDTAYSIKTITVVPRQKIVLGPGRGKTGVATGGLFDAGFEIGRVFEPKSYPVKIISLNFYFLGSTLDTCTFRINFYNLKNGIPSEKIAYKNLIFRGHYDKGWLTFNLEHKDLWIDQPFFASIEWLPAKELNKKYNFGFGANILASKKTYGRRVSLGNLKKMEYGNIIMNVEIQY